MKSLEQQLLLEHEISKLIGSDNGATVHFTYNNKYTPIMEATVSVVTINPKTKEAFLLKQEICDNEMQCLEKILTYVKSQKGLNSFTVKWMKKGEAKENVSYFYCHDIVDAVSNFFHNKNSADYTITEIKLNPIS